LRGDDEEDPFSVQTTAKAHSGLHDAIEYAEKHIDTKLGKGYEILKAPTTQSSSNIPTNPFGSLLSNEMKSEPNTLMDESLIITSMKRKDGDVQPRINGNKKIKKLDSQNSTDSINDVWKVIQEKE